MQSHRLYRSAVLAFAICAVLVPALVGQTVTATLSGTVLDPSGAVVPKANVILKNEASGDVRRTFANSDGYFTFAAVPPSSYNVSNELKGFTRWETTGVVLNAGDKQVIPNISLKVGSTQETVTVEASAGQVTPAASAGN